MGQPGLARAAVRERSRAANYTLPARHAKEKRKVKQGLLEKMTGFFH
jgi:hypothetical protein